MLQNFAPFNMNMPFYGSRGSLNKDSSGGLMLQVRYERFYNSICIITILIMNNVAHRYVIVAFSTLLQNGVPLCMNVPSGGSSSQGNVVPTLNFLSNSNPNDPSLRQVSSFSYLVILGFTCYRSIYNISILQNFSYVVEYNCSSWILSAILF